MTERVPRAEPITERLGAVVGRWHTTGHVIADPPIPVVGTDIYEWLPGGHFLVQPRRRRHRRPARPSYLDRPLTRGR
jgi:hypothetical protein